MKKRKEKCGVSADKTLTKGEVMEKSTSLKKSVNRNDNDTQNVKEMQEVIPYPIEEKEFTLICWEAKMATHQKNSYEHGYAMYKILDKDLYITAGYDEFEDYCRERWGYKDMSEIRNLVWAATIYDDIRLYVGIKFLPDNILRLLALGYLSPEEQVLVYLTAIEDKKNTRSMIPTLRELKAARKKIYGEKASDAPDTLVSRVMNVHELKQSLVEIMEKNIAQSLLNRVLNQL